MGEQYILHLGALGSKLCCPGGRDTDLQLPGERHVAEVQRGGAVAVALGKHRQNDRGCSPYSHQHPISRQRWIPETARAPYGWSWPGNPPGGLTKAGPVVSVIPGWPGTRFEASRFPVVELGLLLLWSSPQSSPQPAWFSGTLWLASDRFPSPGRKLEPESFAGHTQHSAWPVSPWKWVPRWWGR